MMNLELNESSECGGSQATANSAISPYIPCKVVSKLNEKLKFPPIGGWQYMPSAGRDGIQLQASALSSRPPHRPYVLQLLSGNQNVSSHVQRNASAVG